MYGKIALFIIVAVITSPALWGCKQKRSPLINRKCGTCHEVAKVYGVKKTAQNWDTVIFGMKARGLTLTPAEEEQIKDFLKKHHTVP